MEQELLDESSLTDGFGPGTRVDSALLAAFLSSELLQAVGHWEDRPPPEVDEVTVEIEARWPDAGRALRAAALVDRELRRCAVAYAVAEENTKLGLRGAGSPAALDFRNALALGPHPTAGLLDDLHLLSVAGPPLLMRLKPGERVARMLAARPASAAVFALGAFGTALDVELVAPVDETDDRALPLWRQTHTVRWTCPVHRVEGPYRPIARSPEWGVGCDLRVIVTRTHRGEDVDKVIVSDAVTGLLPHPRLF